MLRYFAIATVIVLAIAVFVTARARLGIPGHLNFWKVSPSPPPVENVSGDAPWALSALPGCFVQRSETTGSITYVRTRLPAAAQPVAPGTRLNYGSCTIFVRSGELLVDRGSDRLRVPPYARLYRFDDSLALLRSTATSSELRIYDITANHE